MKAKKFLLFLKTNPYIYDQIERTYVRSIYLKLYLYVTETLDLDSELVNIPVEI